MAIAIVGGYDRSGRDQHQIYGDNLRDEEAFTGLQANSLPVTSNQRHLHPRLVEVVRRHLHSTHQSRVSPRSLDAYQSLTTALGSSNRPLILDSFCGTGQSTAALAARYREHLVVGIDKSAHRLSKHQGSAADNYLLLHANCEDIWQLLAKEGRQLDYHYLLYPNPWPKSAHLQRRIHGHASFPLLQQLGGCVELRSNWQLYVEEFGVAMQLAGSRGRIYQLAEGEPDLTLFERKYRNSGHPLWTYTTER